MSTEWGHRDVWRMVDGWGHVLADRGSGAWIGLEGLRAALAAEDHVPGGSAYLHQAAVQAWGEPRTWPRAVMTTPDAQARLAAFAPIVASLVGKDAVAALVVTQAAAHLADSLESAAAALTGAVQSAARPSPPVGAVGAVGAVAVTAVGGLLNIPELSAALDDETRRRGMDLTVASGTALGGALRLGCHVGEGRALAARSPYVLLSSRLVRL